MLEHVKIQFFSHLNTDSKFRPSMWYNHISLAEDFSNNTNTIETLNRVLKSQCPNGKINFYSAANIYTNSRLTLSKNFTQRCGLRIWNLENSPQLIARKKF